MVYFLNDTDIWAMNVQYFGDDKSSYYTRVIAIFCLRGILMAAAKHHFRLPEIIIVKYTQYPSSRVHEPWRSSEEAEGFFSLLL